MSKLPKIKWDQDGDAAVNARKHLPLLVSNYFELCREVLAGQPEPAALHPLRLATKQLRYTLELFKPCYGPGLKTRLADLHALQQVLGDVNDTVAAAQVLSEFWQAKTPERARVEKYLRQRGQAKVREFREHWTVAFDAPGQDRWWTNYLARHSRRPSRKS